MSNELTTDRSSSSSSSRISRQWSNLNSDILVSVLTRLSTADLISGVSSVCSSWRAAARNPHCWRILDLSDWDYVTARITVPVNFNQVFNCVLGFVHPEQLVEQVYFPPVATGQDLILVSDRLPNLLYISFPNPNNNVQEDEICTAFTKFKSLKGMAITQYSFMSGELLSICATNFPNLTELKIFGGEHDLYKYLVLMICKYFPKLRKLEMPNMQVSSSATICLLNLLQDLEYLDISGYELGISKGVIEKASRLKVFIWHSNCDLGEFVECSNCEEGQLGATCECHLDQRVMHWLISQQ